MTKKVKALGTPRFLGAEGPDHDDAVELEKTELFQTLQNFLTLPVVNLSFPIRGQNESAYFRVGFSAADNAGFFLDIKLEPDWAQEFQNVEYLNKFLEFFKQISLVFSWECLDF